MLARLGAAFVGAVATALLQASLLSTAALGAGQCPNEQIRAEDRSSYLPDCRAYELVSPTYKEGHNIVTRNVSGDGLHVIGQSFGVFAGTEDDPKGSGLLGASYEFSRTGSGWMTTALAPPASRFAEDFSGNAPQLVSSDFGTTSWVLNTALQPPRQRDLYLRKPDGSFVLVGAMTPPSATAADDNEIIGGSASDLSHVLFYLTENRWPGDLTAQGVLSPSLYELTMSPSAQEPKLVGVKNDGPLASNTEAALVSLCGTKLGAAAASSQEESRRAISEDGRIVLFTALECEGAPQVNELYARIDAAKTIPISEPSLSVPGRECTATCKADEEEPSLRSEGVFAGASTDGSKVYFTTGQPLLNSDGDTTTDLYETEITSSGVQRLIQVSKGDASDVTPGSGAGVLSVSAISSDGSRVYFVAEGVLTTASNEQGSKASAGVPNLYMVEPASGRTTYVTTVGSSEAEFATLTPDGRFLVFSSLGQLFEYDSLTGALVSVAGAEGATYVSNDGSYVFFTNSAALTPQALNDPSLENIYEYHNGQVSLISDGRSGASLLGIDASAKDVFFETGDSLVPQDTDTQTDVYDARIGGGFAPPGPPPACSGDGCQGPASAAPSFPIAGSTTGESGNLPPPASKPATKPLTRAQRLAMALKKCHAKHDRHKRARCEAQARAKYGSPRNAKKTSRRGG